MKTKRKLVILEFIGLPACGQEATAISLKDKFEEIGYKTIFLSDISIKADLRKFKTFLLTLRYGGIRLGLSLLFLALSIKPMQKERIRRAYIVYYIFSRYVMASKNNKEYDILIASHGFIQGILAIFNLEPLSPKRYRVSKILKYIEKKKLEFATISCRINISLSYQRILMQNIMLRGFDQKGEENLIANLEKLAKSFECIYEIEKENISLTNFFIDTSKPIDENTDYLASFIQNLF